VKNRLEDNQVDKQMTELEREIRGSLMIATNRSAGQWQFWLRAQKWANANHLAQHTGYPREFVRALMEHMEEGGLWPNGLLDDQEWWDSNGEFNGIAVFTHAHVALGLSRREPTSYGARYLIQELES
jgi:hypothetical protein